MRFVRVRVVVAHVLLAGIYLFHWLWDSKMTKSTLSQDPDPDLHAIPQLRNKYDDERLDPLINHATKEEREQATARRERVLRFVKSNLGPPYTRQKRCVPKKGDVIIHLDETDTRWRVTTGVPIKTGTYLYGTHIEEMFRGPDAGGLPILGLEAENEGGEKRTFGIFGLNQSALSKRIWVSLP